MHAIIFLLENVDNIENRVNVYVWSILNTYMVYVIEKGGVYIVINIFFNVIYVRIVGKYNFLMISSIKKCFD